jgi:3-mercaptopyruvate sulfurtransferase SseA
MKKTIAAGPMIIIGGGVVLILVALVWLFSGQIKPFQVNVTKTPLDVSRVTLKEAKTAYDNQQALILDVRDSESYSAAHIPGAVNIPINEIETRFEELDANQWIITYCT